MRKKWKHLWSIRSSRRHRQGRCTWSRCHQPSYSWGNQLSM